MGPAGGTPPMSVNCLLRTGTGDFFVGGELTEVDLTGLAPGLYALRVAAGGETATRRLVVE